jgi:hypothetical protein
MAVSWFEDHFVGSGSQLRDREQARAVVIDDDAGAGEVPCEDSRIQHRGLARLQIDPRNARHVLAVDRCRFGDQQLVRPKGAELANGLVAEVVDDGQAAVAQAEPHQVGALAEQQCAVVPGLV